MKNRKEEQQSDLANLLNRAGCPVQTDTGFHAPPSGLLIEQVPEVGLNTVFDLPNGGTGFVLDILIQNERHGPIWLDGFQIEDPWGTSRSLSSQRQGNRMRDIHTIASLMILDPRLMVRSS